MGKRPTILEIDLSKLPPKNPHCAKCGRYIGFGPSGRTADAGGVCERGTCGACANPERLSRAEWRRLKALIRQQWASGGPAFELFRLPGYIPHFYTRLAAGLIAMQDAERKAELLAGIIERAELADLYDRVQAQRGSDVRAIRG